MKTLLIQLKAELLRFNVSVTNPIESLFIGGGTPSTVEPSLYHPLFELIDPYLKKGAEITSEANPNSATREWLEGMFELGVNRLSFGVQSFNNEKLKSLGRAHNTSHTLDAIRTASAIGYKHLSIDLIYGVRGDTKELLQSDIIHAFNLPIDHLSLYALTIEEETAFEKTPEKAYEELELTQWLFREVTTRGFQQYEISNFGKYRSAHNLGYWEGKEYIGLGAGAVGFIENKRLYPSRDVEYFISNPCEIHEELLEKNELLSEKLFLGWRSVVGVDETLLTPQQKKEADLLVTEKILFIENGRYYNPNFLIADEIALRVEGF